MAKKKVKPKAKKPRKKVIKSYQFDHVTIPKDKEPKEFNYIQRRAHMITLIEEAGHPEAISQRSLAALYGVSQPQICKDMVSIKDYFRKKIGKDADVISSVFYESAIKKLLKQQKIIEAGKLIKDWNDWMFDTGRQEKAPEKIEAKVDMLTIKWKEAKDGKEN